jgi:hypothetical protein
MTRFAAIAVATQPAMVRDGRSPASLVGEQVLYPCSARNSLEIGAINLVDAVLRDTTQPVAVLEEGNLVLDAADRAGGSTSQYSSMWA